MNMRRPPNWEEFRAREAPVLDPTAEPLAVLTARLFETPDGRRWLAAQRADKFGRSLDPGIAESALRHLEGQRQMLRDIDRDVADGLEQMKQAKKPA